MRARFLSGEWLVVLLLAAMLAAVPPLYRWIHPDLAAFRKARLALQSGAAAGVAQAAPELARMLAHRPTLLEELAGLLIEAGYLKQAVELLQAAWDANEKNSALGIYLASLLWGTESPQAALAVLDQLPATDLHSPKALSLRGGLLLATRDYPAAIAALEALPEPNREDRLNLVRALVALKRETEAVPILQQLLREYPGDATLRLEYARALGFSALRDARAIVSQNSAASP